MSAAPRIAVTLWGMNTDTKRSSRKLLLVAHGIKREGWLPIDPLAKSLISAGKMDELPEEISKLYFRAVRRGHISIWGADEICCKVLAVHPVTIFGAGWVEALAFYDDDESEVTE